MENELFPVLRDHFSVADRSTSSVINQRAILDKIYQQDGISKAQLAKELGISKPAVASNVEKLVSTGLVFEKGEGESSTSGGRKPVMLHFNEKYNYIGTLDLSYRVPICTVCDLKYQIIGLQRIYVNDSVSEEERRMAIKQAFLEILLSAEIPIQKLGLVIISQPGISNDDMNVAYLGSRHKDWIDLGLRSFLQHEFSVPVFIKNDVNLAAVGEVHFGTNEPLRDLLYVSCGVGLGAGLVIGGELYEGSGRAAGEIGFMLQHDGSKVEDIVTMSALKARVEEFYAANGKNETVTFPLIVKRLKDGDAFIEQTVYEIGSELGRVILNCCMLLDIPTVIFGGEYLELGPALFKGMRDFMEKSTVSHHKLIPSSLKDAACLYGGFVVGKEKIFSALLDS